VAIQDEIPQSRVTLKYRTTINGEEEDIVLPLRTLVMGDFSTGTSKDRQVDFDQREMRQLDGSNTVDDLMQDMGIKLNINVPNTINPHEDDIDVNLSLSKVGSFSPDEVAQQIPQVKSLLLLKQLLIEMQSNIDNRRDLRKLVHDICANPESIQKILGELQAYKGLRLPTADDNDGNGGGEV